MMAERLRGFAFGRPAAFPILGRGGAPLWHRFLAGAPVLAAQGPHDTDLLVLAGDLPAAWRDDIAALFETVALPRAAVWLRPGWAAPAPEGLPLAASPTPGETPDWPALRRALLDPASPANRALLPDQPPAPWRGKGDHGQGGEGMMGGKPYGRPMAMVDMDPVDDLMLGALPTALGPWFPGLPAGLTLRLVLQGDRIAEVAGVENAFPAAPLDPAALPATLAPAARALVDDEQPIESLERARLASHLAWMADLLSLLGLGAMAQAARRLIAAPPDAGRIGRLIRRAERAGLRRLLHGLAVIDRGMVEAHGLAGPMARAAGVADDARCGDPAYADLGFDPVLETGGDAWARWRVRAQECLDSVRMIADAGDRQSAAAESPRGRLVHAPDGGLRPPSRPLFGLLPGLLALREWAEATAIVASLDLDPAEAALT